MRIKSVVITLLFVFLLLSATIPSVFADTTIPAEENVESRTQNDVEPQTQNEVKNTQDDIITDSTVADDSRESSQPIDKDSDVLKKTNSQQQGSNIKTISKRKRITIISVTVQNGKTKVIWENDSHKTCILYAKKGAGKYKRICKSRTGKATFPIKKNVRYTVYVKNNNTSSKAVTFRTNSFLAPKLKSLSTYPKQNKKCSRLIFASKKGYTYVVYRKYNNRAWKRIKTVTATASTVRIYDTITQNCTYTVRRYKVTKSKIIRKYGEYDKAGISTIIEAPHLSLDATNLKTTIKWDKISNVSGYLIYIKVGRNGAYRRLAKTSKTEYSYMYRRKLKTEEEINATVDGKGRKYFVDPDSNPFVYAVRAYKKKGNKTSYSNYLSDGEFSVITPNIISYEDGCLTWHTVKNADYYQLYISDDGNHWIKKDKIKAETAHSQSVAVSNARFYGVSTIVIKNGATFESDYDKGFDISHRNDNTDVNMLWIGCSTEWGSPYYSPGDIPCVNSYPNRISQCTGVKFYNPSVPGATLANRLNEDGTQNQGRIRLVTDVVEKIREGKNTIGPRYCQTENTQRLEDFDIIMLPAGGNDYTDNIPLGNPNDTDSTTFYGVYNTILSWIDEASRIRVQEGKAPIKLVFVEMFYSERCTGKWLERHDRFYTPNAIGLTYTDYQNVMDNVYQQCLDAGKSAYRIDTTKYVNHTNSPYATSDNLHMTRFTYSQIGNGIAKDMIEQGILK